MQIEEIQVETIDIEGDYELCEVCNGYIILRRTNVLNKVEYKKMGKSEYYSKFEKDSNYYEALFLNIKNFDIANIIFKMIYSFGKALPNTVEQINDIFGAVSTKLTLPKKRGLFAELYSIINLNLIPYDDKNYIYDMKDTDGNDVEIKSFSKTKREVKINYQQLTNNNNAKFMLLEVIETSSGSTIFELYDELPINVKSRYSWIECLDLPEKFSISNESSIIEVAAKDINSNISLPNGCKNATFVFEVDLIKTIKN